MKAGSPFANFWNLIFTLASSGLGFAHIKDKHPDFDVNLIPEIIKNGKIINKQKKTDLQKVQNINIRYKNYKLGIRNGFNMNNKKVSSNRWIVTSFEED